MVLTSAIAMVGGIHRPANAAVPGVDAKGLPAGWEAAPLGTDETNVDKQSVTVADNKYTLVAGGKDIGAEADGVGNEADGGMIVFQRHTGNGSIVMRLLSQTGGHNDGLVKTAVAFRESLNAGSPDLNLAYSSGNQLLPQIRVAEDQEARLLGELGANSIGFAGNPNANSPGAGRKIGDGIWIGMERNGDLFSYFWSEDGKLWNRVGRARAPLAAELLVGIEASAHKDEPADASIPNQTSVADNVTVSNDLLSPRSISNITYLPRDKSVLVTWTPIAVADGDVTYNVYQINANGSERKKVNTDPLKGSSFMVESLTNGQPYRFAVTATVNGVESPLAFPEPNSNTQNGFRAIGIAVPGPTVLGGLQLYHIGTIDQATVAVTGEGDAAKLNFHAGGTNIWESGDGAAFLAMPIEGDFDVSAQFVSGPTDAQGGGWDHGGIMARESLDPGSRFAYAQLAQANQLQFKRRRELYQQPTNSDTARDDNTLRPISMRLTRTGDTFQSFYSEDNGKTWKDIGDPSNADLAGTNKDTLTGFAKTAFVGITLVAHETGPAGEPNADYTDAEIDNIKFVGKPAP